MTVLYPNLCYNEVCYKWIALYKTIVCKDLHSAESSLLAARDSVDVDSFCFFEHCEELSQFFLFSNRLFSITSLRICVLGEPLAAGLQTTPSIRSGSISGFILKQNT